jgi:cytochrome c-type biogenesis protein CcmH/NrfG
MNEWWLVVGFCLLASFAFLLVIYPFRQSMGKWWLVFLPLFFICVTGAYQQWGSWSAWHDYIYEQARHARAEAVLATIKSPAQLAEKLKAKLDDSPASARGWYLLGRVYVSQNEWLSARDAFAKSHQLNVNDELTTIHYAQSLWTINNQKFNEEIRTLFRKLLKKNPAQPDALAMLAMDAYECHDYSRAELYWQRLLKLAPENSKEAKAIRKAIAKAQQHQTLSDRQ